MACEQRYLYLNTTIIFFTQRDLQALGVVKKVSFSDGHVPATFPDTSPVLQWSPDGVTFHDSPFTVI